MPYLLRPGPSLTQVQALLRLGGASTRHLECYQVRILEATDPMRPPAEVRVVRFPTLQRWFGPDAGEGWDP